jgi:hypothetical protein
MNMQREVVYQKTESSDDVMPLFFKALTEATDLLLPQLQAVPRNIWWGDDDETR